MTVRNGNELISSTASLVITHSCATKAELSAALTVSTRTRTDNAFVGFHSHVQINLGPAYWQSGVHTFGVNGTWGGPPDRTDPWSESVPLSVADADRNGGIYINQTFSS